MEDGIVVTDGAEGISEGGVEDSGLTEDLSTQDGVETGGDESATGAENVESEVDRYRVKIDGDEFEVDVNELVNGYQRQQDYTRKTQELAAERQRLETLAKFEAALETNPQAALEALAKAYQVQLSTPNEEFVDPLERELATLKQQIASITQASQEQQRVAQVTAQAAQAITAHKLTDVDAEGLISYAVENEIMNLNTAARLMAAEGRTAKTKAEITRITNAKRAAQVVEGGSTRTASAAPQEINTIADAWAAAKAELGF